jgi:hypothetical protein
MGKGWDDLGKGASQRLWHKDWIEAAFRVLRPGGVLKAFNGTRTMHHMAMAMETAGFEKMTFEAWSYGCLSEDSEVLTESGWKLGTEVVVGERVACWDSTTGEITLQAVQETFRGPYKGDLVSFKNDNTDQALTPNHRVYKKSSVKKRSENGVREQVEDPTWNVQEAGAIRRSADHLRLPLAGTHNGTGIGGTDLAEFLGWIWTEGGFDRKGTGVRIYQSSVNQPYVDAIQALVDKFAPNHSHYKRFREHTSRNPKRGRYDYTEHCWYFSGEAALQVRSLLPDKHPTWDLVWKMTQEEKRAFMWAAIRGDGTIKEGKLLVGGGRGVKSHTFFQDDEDDLILFQGLCHLTGRQGRIHQEKYSVCVHDNPVTQMQDRHFKASPPIPYDGDVWCVRVPTGAFLARRNKQVFITGNSGFPKSHNISKAIDKMKGAKRETKRIPHSGEAMMRHGGDNTRPWIEEALKVGYHEAPGDTPVSDEAKLWDGWGTALKPAWEPVIVAYKPL